MSTTQYLYLTELGDAVVVGTIAPTKADLDGIDAGILQVIRITSPTHPVEHLGPMMVEGIDAAGEGYPLGNAIMVIPEDEDDTLGEHHYVP